MLWSPSGVDLAVADAQGRVWTFSMTPICLNQLSEVRSGAQDIPDALGQPIGAMWLNQDRHDRPVSPISHLYITDTSFYPYDVLRVSHL